MEKVGEGVTEVNPKDTVMLIKPFQGKCGTMEIIDRNLERADCSA